jgi:hypothetical protein
MFVTEPAAVVMPFACAIEFLCNSSWRGYEDLPRSLIARSAAQRALAVSGIWSSLRTASPKF